MAEYDERDDSRLTESPAWKALSAGFSVMHRLSQGNRVKARGHQYKVNYDRHAHELLRLQGSLRRAWMREQEEMNLALAQADERTQEQVLAFSREDEEE